MWNTRSGRNPLARGKIVAILFLQLLESSLSVLVYNVTLEGGRSFAQLRAPATLHCHYEVNEGATLQKLGWFRDRVPVMTWIPPDPPIPSPEYLDKLDLSGSEGDLVFNEMKVEDAGPYTCTVQSSDNKQDSSDSYSLVVADVPRDGFLMLGNVTDCTLHFSFSSPPIYPKPTPLCGVWATETSYTTTAADWQAVPYYNGSVAYSIANTTFPIRGMPLQAGIRCELSFPPPEGSASADKVIAFSNTAYYPEVSERGCPALEVGDNIEVKYMNHRVTCRGEVAALEPSKQLIAMISCPPGMKSSLRGGAMASLQLQCVGDRQWEPLGGVSWDEFEDMECTEGDGTEAVDNSAVEAESSSAPREESVLATSAVSVRDYSLRLLLLPFVVVVPHF